MKIDPPKDQPYFSDQYREISDSELLHIAAEGGLIPEADTALRSELNRRDLSTKNVRDMQRRILQGDLQIKAGSNPYNRGTGLRFRGERILRSSGTAQVILITTRWIEFLYMPLIPIGSYKVLRSKKDGSTKVIGRAKTQWDQVWSGWGRTLLLALGYVALISVFSLWKRIRK